MYEGGALYFEIENTIGSNIESIIVKSVSEEKEVLIDLSQGVIQPVSLPIEVIEWAAVYPKGCEGINFKNLSFEPNG